MLLIKLTGIWGKICCKALTGLNLICRPGLTFSDHRIPNTPKDILTEILTFITNVFKIHKLYGKIKFIMNFKI